MIHVVPSSLKAPRSRCPGVRPARDGSVIRLAILAHHYRIDWDWTDDVLQAAQARLERWTEALSREQGPDPEPVLQRLREALADDLDAPTALAAVDRWATDQLTHGGTEQGAEDEDDEEEVEEEQTDEEAEDVGTSTADDVIPPHSTEIAGAKTDATKADAPSSSTQAPSRDLGKAPGAEE